MLTQIKILLFTLFLSTTFFSCKKDEIKNFSEWKAPIEFPAAGRQNAIAFSIGSKGFVGLGNGDQTAVYTDLWEYDADNNTWTRKADFPGTAKFASTGFVIGDKGYVVNGFNQDYLANGLCDCNDFWQYDAANNSWARKADFPVIGLHYTVSFVLEGKAYVATGIKDGVHQKALWEYDPLSDKWTRKADYPGTAIDAAASFAIAGKGYIATGNQAVGVSKALWQYDPASDTWTRKADFPYESYGSVAFSLNGKGYIGFGHAGTEFWEYNPDNDTWQKSVDFKTGGRTGAAAFVINNKAYVGLGTSAWTVYPTDIWMFSGNAN